MLDLARTIAPACLLRATWKASREAVYPAGESDPAVTGRAIVSKLSLTIVGTQKSGHRGWGSRGTRSRESATSSARGFTTTRALMAGPALSYAAMRAR